MAYLPIIGVRPDRGQVMVRQKIDQTRSIAECQCLVLSSPGVRHESAHPDRVDRKSHAATSGNSYGRFRAQIATGLLPNAQISGHSVTVEVTLNEYDTLHRFRRPIRIVQTVFLGRSCAAETGPSRPGHSSPSPLYNRLDRQIRIAKNLRVTAAAVIPPGFVASPSTHLWARGYSAEPPRVP